MQRNHKVRLAADIGGTFTDVVLEVGAERYSAKVLSTPHSSELAVLEGMESVLVQCGRAASEIDIFVHGATLATNALIERKGARTAFLTTEGFRDILAMGYEKRFDHYDLMIDPVPPIVPTDLRFTVAERLAADGTVITPLDEAALAGIAAHMTAVGVEAVAIGFLHAYAHPAHEQRAAEILRAHLPPAVTICVSHEVCPEIREYERFVSTCANAYVRPLMAGYLTRLRAELTARGVAAPMFLMMSGGGLTTLESATRLPIRLVESGPAGGAILASHIAKECGLDEVLSFDMGGTTAKICLISKGVPERSRLFEVARTYRNLKGSGWPVRIPVIEMVEIGAGGGSIARVDQMGRIAVGPDSAGADPGPACYGLGGTAPTVTDANVALGKIDPAWFAGGEMALDLDAAEAALRQIGDPLKLIDPWPAAGVAEIVEENMANAARIHAIERGKDIGACTMIAFGGAAPLHVCRLADKLGIDRIVVPTGAGVGSAIGFLKAPVAFEATRSHIAPLATLDAETANALLREMTEAARAVIAPALGAETPTPSRIVDMRYSGQGHEIRVPLPDGPLAEADIAALRAAFEDHYRANYGLTLPNMGVETVTWSVTLSSAPIPHQAAADARPAPAPAPRHNRPVFDPALGRSTDLPVYDRADLRPGCAVPGPAIIAEAETSTILTADFRATVNSLGYLMLERT
jgi:N-methylhydantoinase A